MKKRSNVSLGPGASSLILIFVVLAMTVLGMLALMNGRNDIRLSERSAQVAESVYALQAEAEEKRAEIDALVKRAKDAADTDEALLAALGEALPEEMQLEGRTVSWIVTDGFRRIDCGLEVQPLGSNERTAWVTFDLTSETEESW